MATLRGSAILRALASFRALHELGHRTKHTVHVHHVTNVAYNVALTCELAAAYMAN